MTIDVTGYGKVKLSYAPHRLSGGARWLAEWKRDDVAGYGYGATIEEAIIALVQWK